MLQYRRGVIRVDDGEGMCATPVANEQRIALRVVTRIIRTLSHANKTSIGILRPTRRDTLRDDARAGVLADVNHLSARIGLLIVVGHGHGVELARRVIARQNAAGVLPCDSRARLDLCPREVRTLTADTALRNEVIDTALTLLIAWVPVLYGRVLNIGISLHHNLHNGSVQLVLVAAGCCAALQVAHIRALVRNDERALKLTRTLGIDAEVGRELHGATHTLGDVAERAVGEDRSVECRIEVIRVGHHRAQILLNEFGVLLYSLRD